MTSTFFLIGHPNAKRVSRNGLLNIYVIGTFTLLRADRLFVAILYTSDSDKIMRYTDEVCDHAGTWPWIGVGSCPEFLLVFAGGNDGTLQVDC